MFGLVILVLSEGSLTARTIVHKSLSNKSNMAGKMSLTKLENIEKIILKSISEGVITIDCAGNIMSANPSAEKIFGVNASSFTSRHYRSFFGDDRNLAISVVLDRLVTDGLETSHSEIVYHRRDGQEVSLAVSSSALDLDTCYDGLETFVVVFRDISAFKALEKVRKKAVNHMAHELATPVSVIQATVNSLKQAQNLNEKTKKYLDRIDRNLERLINIEAIVEQILYPPHFLPVKFDLHDVLSNILTKIQHDCAHRKIEFRIPLVDFVIDRTDPQTFEIIIVTLVKNAIENTPDGGYVEIRLTFDNSFPILAVADRGVGISLEDQNFIFEGFHHTQETDEYSTRKPYDFNAGGKGLELLRLKSISENHGFDLSFDSSRCIHIPKATDHCPGDIEKCQYVKSREECFLTGGSTFYVKFL